MPVAVGAYAGDPITAVGTSAAAPGAGSTIATLNLPGPGRYEVEVIASYGATGDVADNIRLRVVQGTPSVTKDYPVAMGAGASGPEVRNVLVITVFGFGNAVLSVQNVLAGGAGSIYNATIIARPLLA